MLPVATPRRGLVRLDQGLPTPNAQLFPVTLGFGQNQRNIVVLGNFWRKIAQIAKTCDTGGVLV